MAESDYRQAGIPMLPVVAGRRRTARAMLGYAVVTMIVSLVPVFNGELGIPYLAAALAAGAWLVGDCYRHLCSLTPASAKKAFVTSLGYLAMVFSAAALDSLVG
jgi:protoheme IX farnesyltransferase